MSFDKHYPKRKDKRKPYYGSKAFVSSCRNHGGCPYCLGNRLHKHDKRNPIVFKEELVLEKVYE